MNIEILKKLHYDQIVIVNFDALIIKARFDSTFDDDNGFEVSNPQYKEYDSYLFEVLEIIKDEKSTGIKPGDLFICNEDKLPLSIEIDSNQ